MVGPIHRCINGASYGSATQPSLSNLPSSLLQSLYGQKVISNLQNRTTPTANQWMFYICSLKKYVVFQLLWICREPPNTETESDAAKCSLLTQGPFSMWSPPPTLGQEQCFLKMGAQTAWVLHDLSITLLHCLKVNAATNTASVMADLVKWNCSLAGCCTTLARGQIVEKLALKCPPGSQNMH